MREKRFIVCRVVLLLESDAFQRCLCLFLKNSETSREMFFSCLIGGRCSRHPRMFRMYKIIEYTDRVTEPNRNRFTVLWYIMWYRIELNRTKPNKPNQTELFRQRNHCSRKLNLLQPNHCSYTKPYTSSFEPIRSWGQTPVTNTSPIFLTLVCWLDEPFYNCFIRDLYAKFESSSKRVNPFLYVSSFYRRFVPGSSFSSLIFVSVFPLFSEVSVF